MCSTSFVVWPWGQFTTCLFLVCFCIQLYLLLLTHFLTNGCYVITYSQVWVFWLRHGPEQLRPCLSNAEVNTRMPSPLRFWGLKYNWLYFRRIWPYCTDVAFIWRIGRRPRRLSYFERVKNKRCSRFRVSQWRGPARLQERGFTWML